MNESMQSNLRKLNNVAKTDAGLKDSCQGNDAVKSSAKIISQHGPILNCLDLLSNHDVDAQHGLDGEQFFRPDISRMVSDTSLHSSFHSSSLNHDAVFEVTGNDDDDADSIVIARKRMVRRRSVANLHDSKRSMNQSKRHSIE